MRKPGAWKIVGWTQLAEPNPARPNKSPARFSASEFRFAQGLFSKGFEQTKRLLLACGIVDLQYTLTGPLQSARPTDKCGRGPEQDATQSLTWGVADWQNILVVPVHHEEG